MRRGATRALGRGARPRGGLEKRTVGPQLAEAHGLEWSVRRRVAPPVAARRALVGRAAGQRAGHARAPRAAILARMATAHLAGRRVVLSVVRGGVVVRSRAFARGAVRAGHVFARFNKHTAASEVCDLCVKAKGTRKRFEVDARFLGNVRCHGFFV